MIKKIGLISDNSLNALDSSCEKRDERDDFRAITIKESLSLQLEQAMSAKGISQVSLAKGMKTSPAQVRRLLNPKDGNVTLTTVQKAADIVGCKVRLELI